MDRTVTLTSHHDTLELTETRAAARRQEYVFVGKSIYSIAYQSSTGFWLQAPGMRRYARCCTAIQV
jgi:hypothetical protein